MSVVRCRVIVSGRVQGVFFRDTCQRTARELGVMGTVRNCSDGTVEVVAEGERDVVDALLAWCRTGPPHGTVTGISITDEPPAGESTFTVVGESAGPTT
jgi:acylphosphatase